jgi:hypothetical protein
MALHGGAPFGRQPVRPFDPCQGLGEQGGVIRLEADGREWELPLAALESARLVPTF